MKAKVRLFARLADLGGTRETEVELGEGLSVAEAFRVLCRRFPELAKHGNSLMYAVNAEYVRPDHPLRAGDELALIPPESGGVSVFLGVVRDNSRGRRVLYLEYDAYAEMATRVMREIAAEALARWPITDVAMQHRSG